MRVRVSSSTCANTAPAREGTLSLAKPRRSIVRTVSAETPRRDPSKGRDAPSFPSAATIASASSAEEACSHPGGVPSPVDEHASARADADARPKRCLNTNCSRGSNVASASSSATRSRSASASASAAEAGFPPSSIPVLCITTPLPPFVEPPATETTSMSASAPSSAPAPPGPRPSRLSGDIAHWRHSRTRATSTSVASASSASEGSLPSFTSSEASALRVSRSTSLRYLGSLIVRPQSLTLSTTAFRTQK